MNNLLSDIPYDIHAKFSAAAPAHSSLEHAHHTTATNATSYQDWPALHPSHYTAAVAQQTTTPQPTPTESAMTPLAGMGLIMVLLAPVVLYLMWRGGQFKRRYMQPRKLMVNQMQWWDAFGLILLVLFVGELVMSFYMQAQHGETRDADYWANQPVSYLLPGVVRLGMIALAMGYLRVLFVHGLEGLGLRLPRLLAVGAMAGHAVMAIILSTAVSTLAVIFSSLLGIEVPAIGHPSLEILVHSNDVLLVSSVIFAAVVAAPVVEEFLFRGVLQNYLAHSINFAPQWQKNRGLWAIVITSLLFAAIHLIAQPLQAVLAIFTLSLIMGYIYHRTANLWMVIGIHAIFNAYNVGMTMLLMRESMSGS